MASTAVKRLMQEYKNLTRDPPEGTMAGPVSEDNFLEWDCMIMGPEGTDYEGGCFQAVLKFPPDYPMSPPKMIFKSEMWHPNIYANGEVCISILHSPGEDPNHYEDVTERWSPVQSVQSILLSVRSMLAEPNDESGANIDASKMWREDRAQFSKKVQETVMKSLV